MSIQDDERRELARELHDEVGPHLFAARAYADAARRAALKERPALAETIDPIVDSIDASRTSIAGFCTGCGPPRCRSWARRRAVRAEAVLGALAARRRHRDRARRRPAEIRRAVRGGALPNRQEGVADAIRHSRRERDRRPPLSLSGGAKLDLSISDNGANAAGFEYRTRRARHPGDARARRGVWRTGR